METTPIRHISDTAVWVATFRAQETERPNPLFRDPLARRLVGKEGERMVREMESAHTVGWSVVLRTCMIDDYLKQAIAQGIDTVLNLGAGLDTRPYRMDLPGDLLWVEVDYPDIVQLKEEKLKTEVPRCRLERISLDLTDSDERRGLFSYVQSRSTKVLILTEGVLPYLSNENALELAQDLHAESRFEFWIVDYWSKMFLARMRKSKTFTKLGNAPFLFDPPEWKEFFEGAGWQVEEMRYTGAEGKRLGRPAPFPFWVKLLAFVMSAQQKKQIEQMSGYALLRARRS